ncbi:MAG TPA: hypothetical protein VLC92_07510 [Rhodocyclaceae bacterium]|nr:hypothetical protein [Rhodocyclaceae bacterium]
MNAAATMPLLRAWRNNALCWWLPGKEVGIPFTLALCIPAILIAIVIGPVFDASTTTRIVIAVAPLMIGLVLFFPGAILRIARVQRSESLMLLPDRSRRLRIALFGIVTVLLVPLLTIALMIRHPAPLVMGMLVASILLLGTWQLPSRGGAPADQYWTSLFFGTAPTLLLTQAQSIGAYTLSPWPLLITSCVTVAGVLWRARQMGRADAMPIRWSLPKLALPVFDTQVLLRAGTMLVFLVAFGHLKNGTSSVIYMAPYAFALDNPEALRARLRLHWINGIDRVGLATQALRLALQSQLVCVLLIGSGLGILVRCGWSDASWAIRMIIAMLVSAPVVLTWQLVTLGRTAPAEEGKSLRRELRRAMPMLAVLPLMIGLIIAIDLAKDLASFIVSGMAISAVLTLIGLPFVRKGFQRIEL